MTLSAIIDFFESIVNAITSVIDFIINFISDTIYMITLTGKFLLQIPTYFSFLPSVLLTMLVTLFGIVVVYKILGRD